MIRASAPYTSGWGSFVLLKMDCVRVARGGSLSTLHRGPNYFNFMQFLGKLGKIVCWTPWKVSSPTFGNPESALYMSLYFRNYVLETSRSARQLPPVFSPKFDKYILGLCSDYSIECS